MSRLDDLESRLLTYYVETHVYSSVNQTFTNIEYESYELPYTAIYSDSLSNTLHDTVLSLQVF